MKNSILRLLRSILKALNVAFNILTSILRVLLYSKRIKKNLSINVKNKLFVLGNGPSLNEVIQDNLNFLSNQDVVVVNDFFLSENFELLKPKIYVIADSAYWEGKVTEDMRTLRNQLQKKLLSNVNWELYFFIPMYIYQTGHFQKIFSSNPYIQIRPFNLTSFVGPKSMRYFFYDKLLAKPLSGNVIGSALFILMQTNAKEIFLFGVEHSWSRSLYVDNQNRTCLRTEHFYSNGEEPKVWLKSNGEPYSIDKALFDISVMLGRYDEIRDYSEYKGKKIYNCTPGSFIDAFERKNWEKLG